MFPFWKKRKEKKNNNSLCATHSEILFYYINVFKTKYGSVIVCGEFSIEYKSYEEIHGRFKAYENKKKKRSKWGNKIALHVSLSGAKE